MRIFRTTVISLVMGLFLLGSGGLALAATGDPTPPPTTTGSAATTAGTACGGGTGLINPLKACDLQTLLGQLLDFAINLGGIILVLMLVWVGFLFVFAQGSEERLTTARTALMWTLIGGLLLLGAKAIEVVVQSTVQGLTS
jgi:hypothetical protein